MSQVNQANYAVTTECRKCLIEKNIRYSHYFDEIYIFEGIYPKKMTECLCATENETEA